MARYKEYRYGAAWEEYRAETSDKRPLSLDQFERMGRYLEKHERSTWNEARGHSEADRPIKDFGNAPPWDIANRDRIGHNEALIQHMESNLKLRTAMQDILPFEEQAIREKLADLRQSLKDRDNKEAHNILVELADDWDFIDYDVVDDWSDVSP
jgi:hypothetical protein